MTWRGITRFVLAALVLGLLVGLASTATARSISATATAEGTISHGGQTEPASLRVAVTADDEAGRLDWQVFTSEGPYRMAVAALSVFTADDTLQLYFGDPKVDDPSGSKYASNSYEKRVISDFVANPAAFTAHLSITYDNELPSGGAYREAGTLEGAFPAPAPKPEEPVEPADVVPVVKSTEADRRTTLRAKVTGAIVGNLIVLSEREIKLSEDLAERVDQVCWMSGSPASAAFAAGELEPALIPNVKHFFDAIDATLVKEYGACGAAMLAMVGAILDERRATGGSVPIQASSAARRPRCGTGAIGVSVDAEGALTLLDETPRRALRVGCGFKGKGKKRKMLLTALTKNKRSSIREAVGKRVQLAVASVSRPTKNPKVKIGVKQSGRVRSAG